VEILCVERYTTKIFQGLLSEILCCSKKFKQTKAKVPSTGVCVVKNFPKVSEKTTSKLCGCCFWGVKKKTPKFSMTPRTWKKTQLEASVISTDSSRIHKVSLSIFISSHFLLFSQGKPFSN